MAGGNSLDPLEPIASPRIVVVPSHHGVQLGQSWNHFRPTWAASSSRHTPPSPRSRSSAQGAAAPTALALCFCGSADMANDQCSSTIVMVITVGVVDGKPVKWRIPAEDVTHAKNGDTFLKLNPKNWSLRTALQKLSVHDAPQYGAAITRNNGVRCLIRERNVAQAASLLSDGAPRCSLFPTPSGDGQQPRQPRPKGRAKSSRARAPAVAPRTSHGNKGLWRSQLDSIAIQIGTPSGFQTVDVLRCVHPRDLLSIKYDMAQVRVVMEYINASDFGEIDVERDHTLPKGVRKQGGKFYVIGDGVKKA